MKRQRGSEAARWPVSESVGERVRARQRDGPGRPGQGGGLGGGSRNGLGSRVAGLRPGRHSHSGTLLGGGPFALGHLHHHPVAGVLPSDDPTKESWDWNDASRVCPLWPWRMARRHQQWALTGWHGIPPFCDVGGLGAFRLLRQCRYPLCGWLQQPSQSRRYHHNTVPLCAGPSQWHLAPLGPPCLRCLHTNQSLTHRDPSRVLALMTLL